MTTAINMFLRSTIRVHGIPFDLKLDEPNEITKAAIEEGRKIMSPLLRQDIQVWTILRLH